MKKIRFTTIVLMGRIGLAQPRSDEKEREGDTNSLLRPNSEFIAQYNLPQLNQGVEGESRGPRLPHAGPLRTPDVLTCTGTSVSVPVHVQKR